MSAVFSISFNEAPSGWLTSIFFERQESPNTKISSRWNQQQQSMVRVARPDTSQYQAFRKRELISAIGELSVLPDNWDGEGAIPVVREAIELAKGILTGMVDSIPLPEFAPNPTGTLSLYWSLPHGTAELEIGRTKYSWALMNRNGSVTTYCSGNNKAFDVGSALVDLCAALTPPSVNTHSTLLTHFAIRQEWQAVELV